MAGMQAGVMNLALIPLIGITPDSYYSISNAYIYTIHMSVDSTSDYSYSYMTIHIQNIFTIFTYCIIPMDYIPTSTNEWAKYETS